MKEVSRRVFALFACLTLAAPALPQAVPAPTRAVLVRGTLAVRGVPHFPANALPALYGEYRWESLPIRVWVIRDELFITAEWTETSIRTPSGAVVKGHSMQAVSGEAQVSVFALREPSYWIVAELPSGGRDPRPFLGVLAARLAYFASQAKAYSDLSLPAVLDIR